MSTKECCEACDGNGKLNGETCKYCKGIGWFEEDSDIKSNPQPESFFDPDPDFAFWLAKNSK